MQIVTLEEIPKAPYYTPCENPMKILAVAQKMEGLCKGNGMGLAASQVGIPWRMFIYWSDYPEEPGEFTCLVDCEYSPITNKKFTSVEGCLSLPGQKFELERYDEVVVSGKRLVLNSDAPVLEEFNQSFTGVLAVVLQHEIDHDHGREKMIDKLGKPIHVSLAWRKS